MRLYSWDYLAFSSNIHSSVALTINNPSAPRFQLRKSWNSERRGEAGLDDGSHGGRRKKMSSQKLLLFITVRNGDIKDTCMT